MAVAELGYKIESQQVEVAEKRLDGMHKASVKADGSSEKLARTSSKLSGGMKVLAARLIPVVAAFASFATVSRLVGQGAQEIDRLAKSARRLETSIVGFRAMELAASEAGVSVSSLTNDVQTMAREVAAGGNKAMEALKKLGIAAKDLENLDADEKMALLADQVQKLGLNVGETTAILRDLGVRNREVVLALISGGDAFRDARKDVEDYGLALSDVDASKIEAANDAIGRLGLISDYAAQQFSLAITPAIGEFSKALTDSLREGGLVRTMIDGLVLIVQRLGSYFKTAGIAAGVYAGYIAAATLATTGFSASLVVLRGALIKTGIGALVIAVGELVYQIDKFRSSADAYKSSLSDIADEQGRINALMDTFYTDMTAANLAAWKSQEEMVRNRIKSSLDLATAHLENAERMHNILWLGIGESKAVNDARAEVERLSAELLEAEARVDGVDQASKNVAKNLGTIVINTNKAKSATDNWNTSMRGVLGSINAIAGAIANIGGKLIGSAAKQVQIDALRAGKSVADAAMASEDYLAEQDAAAKRLAASGSIWKRIGAEAEIAADSIDRNRSRILAAEIEMAHEREALLSGGGAGGGGGGAGRPEENPRIQALIESLRTEQEVIAEWYAQSQMDLILASDAELELIGGRNEAKLRLEEEYQARLAGIRQLEQQASLEGVLSGGAEILGAMGAFNKKALKMQAIFAAGSALISTMKGAAKELEKGTFGFATAAAVIARGLGFIAAIKKAGSSGGSAASGGGGGGGAASVPQQTAPDPRQTRAIIQATGGRSRFTIEEINDIISGIQKESKDGVIIEGFTS